jgi:DNA-binding transcriptional ArsR family regulator
MCANELNKLYDEEILRVIEGLSHPIRLSIYNLLAEKGEMFTGDIFKLIKGEFGVSSHQTLLNHLNVMQISGIVELERVKNRYKAKLKKMIGIEVKEI